MQRPAPVAPDRNGIRQGEFRLFLLLPLSPVPFYLSLSGEPPRRPLNVNDRSPNDEVPPMHNAPPLPTSSAIETSTPTRNLRRGACYLDLFIRIFVRVFEISLSLDHRWGRRNWGRRAKAYSIRLRRIRKISVLVSLTRSVQLFRESRCRQIYSLFATL